MRAPGRLVEIASRAICSTNAKHAIWSGNGYHLSDVLSYFRQCAPSAVAPRGTRDAQLIDNRAKRDFLGIDLNNFFSTAVSLDTAQSGSGDNRPKRSPEPQGLTFNPKEPFRQESKDEKRDVPKSDSKPAVNSALDSPPPTSCYSPDGYDLLETWEDEDLQPEPSTSEASSQPPSRREQRDCENTLSHIEPESGTVHMVDVSAKAQTLRTASAVAHVTLNPCITEVLANVRGTHKGNVLSTAELAGIMAAKQTAALIPLCHGVPLSSVQVRAWLRAAEHRVEIRAEVKCHGVTGVEMEALTAVTVAALTVYDMCKGVSHDMHVTGVRLLDKRGGKRGTVRAAEDQCLPLSDLQMFD